MKISPAIIDFIVVNAFFIAINLVFAGVLLLVGKFALFVFPSADESPQIGFIVGAAGLAAALWFAVWLYRFIESFANRRR